MRRLGLGACAVLLCVATAASAERVRIHYPASAIDGCTPVAPGNRGVVATRFVGLGFRAEPCVCRLRPTHILRYVHPATNRTISVPLALPDGTPQVSHISNRIVYSYTTYQISLAFFTDGSVDVTYNSGIGRPLGWCD